MNIAKDAMANHFSWRSLRKTLLTLQLYNKRNDALQK